MISEWISRFRFFLRRDLLARRRTSELDEELQPKLQRRGDDLGLNIASLLSLEPLPCSPTLEIDACLQIPADENQPLRSCLFLSRA